MSRSKGARRGRQPQAGTGPQVVTGIILGSLTHIGMTRSANQDAFCAILAPNAPPGTDALLAVADGMGGHQGGEVASAMAIQGLVRRLTPGGSEAVAKATQERRISIVEEVVRQVNAEVHEAADRPETKGMGTTLTMGLLVGPSLIIGHVGDSRLYLIRKGRLRQLSPDHSWVAEEVARGAITPDEARVHPRRNIVTRAIGTAAKVDPFTTAIEVEEGDTLLLCSDGLHSLVSDDEIAGMIADQSPQEASQSLVNRANELGGHDNITVIVARVERLTRGTLLADGRTGLDNARTIPVGGRGGGNTGLLRAFIPVRLVWKFVTLLRYGIWRLVRVIVVRGRR